MSSARSVAKELIRLSMSGPVPDPLTYLRLQSLQLGFGLIERRLGLIQGLLTDHLCFVKTTVAVELLLVPYQFGLLGGQGVFLRLEGSLLLCRIDLHQGRACRDAASRMHKDLGNHAFDLRHDYGCIARLQGGNVFRGVVYRNQLSRFDLHRDS